MDTKKSSYKKKNYLNSFSILLFILIITISVGALSLKIVSKTGSLVSFNKAIESARIALSYTNMMIKKNESMGNIKQAIKKDFQNGFIIENYMGDKDLKVAVYFENKAIWENIYSETFDKNLSEKITSIDDAKFVVKDDSLELKVTFGDKTIKKYIVFRTTKNFQGGSDEL